MKINRFLSTQKLSPDELKAQQDKQLKEAGQAYEKYFLNEMVKAMRSTIHKEGGILKENFAEQIFSENLDQEYIDGWSKSGGVGLADMIYQQLQETVAPKAPPRAPGPVALGEGPGGPDGLSGAQKKGFEIYQREANPMKKLDD